MTATRRPDRIVDITDEFLVNMPVSKGWADIWYDKAQPYMFARKMHYRPDKPDIGVSVGRAALRGALIQGIRMKRMHTVSGWGNIAEARALSKVLWERCEELAVLGKGTRGPRKGYNKAIPPQGFMSDPEHLLGTAKEPVENPDYDSLMSVLMDAFQQATTGKGAVRHAAGLHFEDQDLIQITESVGINYPLGQAIKKIVEGRRLKIDKARTEFLGAIIYLAGAVVWLNRQSENK